MSATLRPNETDAKLEYTLPVGSGSVTEVEYRIDGGAWQTGEFTRQGIKPVTTLAQDRMDDFVPTGFTDDPVGVDDVYSNEYISVREGSVDNWMKFSLPARAFGEGADGIPGIDGLDGVGEDGEPGNRDCPATPTALTLPTFKHHHRTRRASGISRPATYHHQVGEAITSTFNSRWLTMMRRLTLSRYRRAVKSRCTRIPTTGLITVSAASTSRQTITNWQG